MPRGDDTNRDTASTPESNFAFVNQVDGALPGLWAVKCADRVNLANRPEADDNPVQVTFRFQYHDVDEGVMRKTRVSHVTSARWVMAAPVRPPNGSCKEFVRRQTVTVPVLHLGQAQASLLNVSRFSDAPATDPTDPKLGLRNKGEPPKPREESEESEAEEENVQVSQVESLC